MKNKIISAVLGLLSVLFFYQSYNQYRVFTTSYEIYKELGNNPFPPEFFVAIFIVLIPAIISLIFSIKFFLKK